MVLDSEDEEFGVESRSRRAVLMDDSDDESFGSQDEENNGGGRRRGQTKPPKGGPSRHRPPRPSVVPRKSLATSNRHRRRSSARFLNCRRSSIGSLSGGADPRGPSAANLGEVYKKAIRMNAENRINAQNSWNLSLIDHIDKFLTEDDESRPNTSNEDEETQEQVGVPKDSRINFTKASCTLDASVKIYSYRVDDVHLTSYKVLANLHRNDNKANKPAETDDGDADDADASRGSRSNKSGSRNTGPTIETNRANININKLDSAFDIDPLFHKMSKTFDEGGAKGLLLVNLGTGAKCDIVFDSTGMADEEEESPASASDEARFAEGMIDVSNLASQLNGAELEGLPLVPQLENLRAQHMQLEEEGFSVNTPKATSRRYAAKEHEEKEADMSIHQEALERSTRQSLNSYRDPQTASVGEGLAASPEYAADDYGGFDDDDDDTDFNAFMDMDENAPRLSSTSFQGVGVENFLSDDPAVRQTTDMLNALASSPSGTTLFASNDYQFINAEALSQAMSQNNNWAGAMFWEKRRTRAQRGQKDSNASKKSKKTPARKKGKSKTESFVQLGAAPDMADLLQMPPKTKRDPLQWSKAVLAKHTKCDNLLPLDAGMGVEQLSKFFLRPDMILSKGEESGSVNTKSVGFDMTAQEWGDGDSFGGEDDGPGFAFADDNDDDDDDFGIPSLEGVRKVDKVRVGYATVAKRVDVKRLKKDLWTELEARISVRRNDAEEEKEDDAMPSSPEERQNDEEIVAKTQEPTSFHDTVQEMESAKSQADVTLPFYFICVLHLANEKCLRLESNGLKDFKIHQDDGTGAPF